MLNEELIYDEAFAEKVRRSFWRDGLIVAMPSQLKKRKVLLDLIALDFESGRTYTEQEEMVDLGLLRREKGLYRKP